MSIKGIIYYNSNWENGIAQLKQIEANYNKINIEINTDNELKIKASTLSITPPCPGKIVP